MNLSSLRLAVAADLPAFERIIDAVSLFPSELLADMFQPAAEEDGFWLAYDDDKAVAVAYCSPEAMTSGTWNLLLIAVHPQRQGEGIGARIMADVEHRLAQRNARVLLVETSGLEHFAGTRAFYARLGYAEEARIRDYYDAGDDKVVFRKAL